MSIYCDHLHLQNHNHHHHRQPPSSSPSQDTAMSVSISERRQCHRRTWRQEVRCQDAATHHTTSCRAALTNQKQTANIREGHTRLPSHGRPRKNTQTQTRSPRPCVRRARTSTLSLSFSLSVSCCTFSPVCHINTVVGKGKSRDLAVQDGAVGTQLRLFMVGSCLVHPALHALLKVHTLKVCPAELQGKGSV